MRKALFVLTVLWAGVSCAPPRQWAAAPIVSIATPAGINAPVDITLDGPAVVTWNSQAVAGQYVTSGTCLPVVSGSVGPHRNPTVIGYTCSSAAVIHLTTTDQLTYTCPVDGGVLEGLHLTVKVDAVVVYDQQLWPNPVTCWITAPRQAVVGWSAPVLTFDNTGQARPSAATVARVADPGWNFSAHTFTVPAGIVCAKNLVDDNPSRYITHMVERGFVCQGIVAAGASVSVVVS